jgi:hypothetical protein
MKARFLHAGLSTLLAASALFAAQPDVQLLAPLVPAAKAVPLSPENPVARVALGALNTAKLTAQDALDANKSVPYRYAISVPLTGDARALLNVNNGGWQTLKSGQARWEAEVFAAAATSVDVVLSPFWLPQNATLIVRDGTGKQVWGPYGHEQNNLAATLPLPMVAGDTLRLELTYPPSVRLCSWV